MKILDLNGILSAGMKWKTQVQIILSVILASLVLGYVWAHREEGAAVKSEALRSAPEFNLLDSLGKSHQLSEFRGTPVILHFWASWCPPCLEEISHWVDLSSEYQSKPIQWIAVSLDRSWSDALKVWTLQPGAKNILSLINPDTSVSDQFGTYQFPETYLLNSDLKIVTKWVGPQDWSSPEIRKIIDTWTSPQSRH